MLNKIIEEKTTIVSIENKKQEQFLDQPVILVVDDERDYRSIIKDKFRKICEESDIPAPVFVEAEDGFKALNILVKGIAQGLFPDLLSVDIQMPIMNGFDFCSKVKKHPELQNIPTVFVSSLLDDLDKLEVERQKNKAYQVGVIQAYDKQLDKTFNYSMSNLLKYAMTHKELKRAKLSEEILKNEQMIKNEELAAKNIALENEINLARRVQCALLPPKKFVKELKLDKIQFDYLYKPMLGIGGDFVDYHVVKNKFGVFICDVSGHGVPAALLASMVKVALNEWPKYLWELSPREHLRNIQMQMQGKFGDNFFTATSIMVDTDTGILKSSSAGHPEYVIARKSNDNSGEYKFHFIKSKGGCITDFRPGLSNFEEKKIQLKSGDVVFMYTDGLTEAHDPQNRMLATCHSSEVSLYASAQDKDQAKFKAFLAKFNWDDTPCNICDQILQGAKTYIGGEHFRDDLALMVFRYTGSTVEM